MTTRSAIAIVAFALLAACAPPPDPARPAAPDCAANGLPGSACIEEKTGTCSER